MSFLVVELKEGELGRIKERDTFAEAVTAGVTLAVEHCGDEVMREAGVELEEDHVWTSEDGRVTLNIAQSDDDYRFSPGPVE